MTDVLTYRNWRPDDPRFNEKEAWPSSLFPEADLHYFRDCGAYVCALAMMLRHNEIERERDEEKFNPWILNEKLIPCGGFSPSADLDIFCINKLYPINYYGSVPYSREALEAYVDMGAYLMFKAAGKEGRDHFLVLDGLTRDDAIVIDPNNDSYKRKGLLSDYEKVHSIRVFRDRFRRTGESGGHEQGQAILGGDPFALLVNEDHPLPGDYKPYDLIRVASLEDRQFILNTMDIQLNRTAVEAFNSLCRQAKQDGCETFMINSGYRSHEDQIELFAEGDDPFVARPGCSEHETGLAIDIQSSHAENNPACFEYVARHGYKYGFILRYPPEKMHYTRIPDEPWHFRYTGREAAITMHEHGWCLEEYHKNKMLSADSGILIKS